MYSDEYYYLPIFVMDKGNDMKHERKRLLIWELANKVNEFVYKKYLFCGGCCFSAFVLAEILDKFGIKYRTVLFQSYDLIHEHDFNNAINSNDCDHVAIEVTLDGKQVIIGDYSDITKYYDTFHVEHVTRRYRDITPKMLKKAYYWNSWNPRYKTKNNRSFRNAMNKIADKYLTPVAA